jgi:hypothetical protein
MLLIECRINETAFKQQARINNTATPLQTWMDIKEVNQF